MLEWRLGAYRRWLTMSEPTWARVTYPKIDFQDIYYYSAPKSKGPMSLDEIDPALLATYDKLGIPLREREVLLGVQGARVAVDAVFDSVSVVTTFREELKKAGVLFCSMSEAIREYPEIVRKYLGSVVPVTDNFYATLNSAVFSDAPSSLCPRASVARWNCPLISASMSATPASSSARSSSPRRGLTSRISRAARRRCGREPAPCRGGRAGRARRCRDQILDRAELVPGRRQRQGRRLQLRHQARRLPGRLLQDLLDAGRDRLGDHLEVSELHPARRQLRPANSIRSPSRTATSRSTAAPK